MRRTANGLKSPVIVALLASATASALRAQEPVVVPVAPPQNPDAGGAETAPQAALKTGLVTYQIDGAQRFREVGDYYETHAQGGFRLTMAELGLVVRGEKLLILNDAEVMREALSNSRTSGLPTPASPLRPERGLLPLA